MIRKIVLVIIALQITAVGCHARSRPEGPEVFPFRIIHLPVAVHPTMPAIADINKDGNLDILVANSSGSISVYLGDGKGNFAPGPGSPFPAGDNCADIATADFNLDGNLDVVVANHGVKTVTILLGNGKGQFSLAPGAPFTVASNPHPHGVTVADFNRDGKPDVVTDSWAENKILVLFGNGDGRLRGPGVKFDVGKMPYQRLRSADVNGDGNPDIVTSNFEAASVSVLLGDGKGGFTRKDFSAPSAPFGVAIADINGDKNLDIVIGHYSGQIDDTSKNGMSVLSGDGNGNFALVKGSPFSTGNYPGTIAAGDLNGDGIADIVVPNYEDGTLTVYLCTKDAIKLAPYSPIRVGGSPHGVVVADLDRDGKGDIIVADEQDNNLLVLLSK